MGIEPLLDRGEEGVRESEEEEERKVRGEKRKRGSRRPKQKGRAHWHTNQVQKSNHETNISHSVKYQFIFVPKSLKFRTSCYT